MPATLQIPREKALPKLSESQVMSQITCWLQAHGYFVIRQNVGVANYGSRGRVSYGKKSASDLVALRAPQAAGVRDGSIFIEVKAPGAKTKPDHLAAQISYRDTRRRSGFAACIVDSLEMFEAWYFGRGKDMH